MVKMAKHGTFVPFFVYLKRLHNELSIKMYTFANESVKEPLKTRIIMQLRYGSPAGTALTFQLRNRQTIAPSADILT